ncbi:hypothetical protein JCM8202v2_005488 [Rhodotorula sphaerocarpa]
MLAPCSFASERLVYRACNFPADDAFLLELANDPETQMGWFGGIVRPKALRDLEGFKKHLQSDTAILAVVICLAPEKGSVATPIGIADLEKREMGGPQNRCAGFGLVIHKDFRGKGYATEAMEWLLRRAFIGYNLHRVEGGVWSWNDGARKLYDKLGILDEEWYARHPDAKQP